MSILTTLIQNASNFISLKPSDKSSIMAAECQLGLVFAPDYKEYLSTFGAASFDGRELTGVCQSERLSVVSQTERARLLYPHLPKDAYVIEDVGFDHIVIVQNASGKVFSYGPTDSGKEIADSLQDYLFSEA